MERKNPNLQELYKSITKGDSAKATALTAAITNLSAAVTPNGDNILHTAICMRNESIAREILKKFKERNLLTQANTLGNTVLHEVAATNMTSLARDLLIFAPELLDMRNIHGETPLFRASHYGEAEMFKVLADIIDKKELKPDEKMSHMKRDDETTILHTTILAEFFDLAVHIAKRYEVLVDKKDPRGMIGLQLLSSNPSAFKSSSNYGFFKKLIYSCVPSSMNTEKEESCRLDSTHESEQCSKLPSNNDASICEQYCFSMVVRIIISVTRKINISIWRFLSQGWPVMGSIYKEKRKHESALELAKFLIPRDLSWGQSTSIKVLEDRISLGKAAARTDEERGNSRKIPPIPDGGQEDLPTTPPEEGTSSSPPLSHLVSLLLATSTGIDEIVKEILRVYPQAVEHVSDMGHNILHVAIQYRQLKIFRFVKKMEIPMVRLVRQFDQRGYTILHHVGITKYYSSRGARSGPAFQLQDELRWFKRVKKIIPSHYEMHRSEEREETALELFKRSHKKLLEEAQEWLKRTSESCSTVAVLIATVAFAAAYTVPGGSDQSTGVPVLLCDPFFVVFTVMDVLSLASSLTSVVMFLSILTSPFQLQDFHNSLPAKLTAGFTFLFFSVASTMLTFAATIVLLIHLKKRWLIYTAAFVPVSIFALLQFPLYLASLSTLKFTWKLIRNVIPSCLLPSSLQKTNAFSIYKMD